MSLDDSCPGLMVNYGCTCGPWDYAWDIPLWTATPSLGGQLTPHYSSEPNEKGSWNPGSVLHPVRAGARADVFSNWVAFGNTHRPAQLEQPPGILPAEVQPSLFPRSYCVHMLRGPFTSFPTHPCRLLPKCYMEKAHSLWIIPVMDWTCVSS